MDISGHQWTSFWIAQYLCVICLLVFVLVAFFISLCLFSTQSTLVFTEVCHILKLCRISDVQVDPVVLQLNFVHKVN